MDAAAAAKGAPVLVTGVGLICSAGRDLNELAAALEEGRQECSPVPEGLFETGLDQPVFVCREDGLARAPNRTLSLLYAAADAALEQAGLRRQRLQTMRVGIAVGTTVGSTFNNEQAYLEWAEGRGLDLDAVARYFSSDLVACLHQRLGTSGPAAVVTNACSSGTDAVGLGLWWLRAGLCDAAICGGADEMSRIALNGFASLQLASKEPARPFDRQRKGLNLGEGASVLVLEREEDAESRGAEARGAVLGYASAADGWHPTAPHPQGRGLLRAMTEALAQAGLGPEAVALICTHGTGTKANDSAEARALSSLYAPDHEIPPCYSLKGSVGHCLGAAGALEAASLIHFLSTRKAPPTPGYEEPDEDTRALPLFRPGAAAEDERSLGGNIGLNLSLAFGGANSALILEGY